MDKDWITISEAAKYLRVSPDTLRRWEKKKILRSFRSPTGWRYYDRKQLDYVFSQKPDFVEPTLSNSEFSPEVTMPTIVSTPSELPISDPVNTDIPEFPEEQPYFEPPQLIETTTVVDSSKLLSRKNLSVATAFLLSMFSALVVFYLAYPFIFSQTISPIP